MAGKDQFPLISHCSKSNLQTTVLLRLQICSFNKVRIDSVYLSFRIGTANDHR